MHNYNKYILKIIFFIFSHHFLFGQQIDTLSIRNPRTAVIRAFMIPGGGQFYNNQKIKGYALLGGAIASSYLHFDFAKKYQNFSGDDQNEKERFLKLRNKYGWWIFIIYFYGLVDALVESHLNSFEDIMSENLEQETSNKKEKENEEK